MKAPQLHFDVFDQSEWRSNFLLILKIHFVDVDTSIRMKGPKIVNEVISSLSRDLPKKVGMGRKEPWKEIWVSIIRGQWGFNS